MLFKKVIIKAALTGLYYLNNEFLYKFLRLFIPQLSAISLHITNKCNFNCTYCYVDKSKPPLNYETWTSLIEEAKKIGIKKISLLGGEPFEAVYLENLLRKIKQLNLKCYIYTNGSFITEEWAEKLVAYNPVLIFKYDLNNELFQFHTHQEQYTLRDIEKKITLCNRRKLRTMTFTILFRDNIGGIEQVFENSLKCGAFPVFHRYMPVKDPKFNESLDIPDNEFLGAIKKINRRLICLKKEWIAMLRILGGGCSFFRDAISISASGNVLPCPYLPDEASLGKVINNSLKEIRSGWLARKNREWALSGECAGCEHKYICRGGCRAYSYFKHGRYLTNCNYEAMMGYCAYMFMDLYGKIDYFMQLRKRQGDPREGPDTRNLL